MEKQGKVWLVGAGPSDPGLLTLKGKQLLEQAQVVVYDALVSAAILAMIPNDAELIYVGKRAGNHPVPQHQINQILLNMSRKLLLASQMTRQEFVDIQICHFLDQPSRCSGGV